MSAILHIGLFITLLMQLGGQSNFARAHEVGTEGVDRITPRTCASISNLKGDPAYVLCEALLRDLDPKLTFTDRVGDDEKYYSQSLYTVLNKYLAKHASDFDADPLTGTQDTAALSIKDTKAEIVGRSKMLVTVEFLIEGAPENQNTVRYLMVQEHGTWKIDDIVYLDEPDSLRQIIKRAF
jgi:hypothetical protein